jgi:hypothetical protein
LHRLVHRFSGDNSRSLDLHSLPLGGFDWSEAVDGVTEGIENATQHLLSDGDIDDGSSSSDGISFLDLSE